MKKAIIVLTAAALLAAQMTSCGIKRVSDDTSAPTREAAGSETKSDASEPVSGGDSNSQTDASIDSAPANDTTAVVEANSDGGETDETAEISSPGGAGRSTAEVTKYGTKYSSAELAALENECKGWGPGVSVDELNRPVGALSYQEKYGQYDADFIIENDGGIFLTFDCGYENGYTEKIIDTLNEKGVKGVFFCTLDYIQRNGDIIRKMIDGGHIVGNHSANHLSMPSLSVEEMESEIVEVHEYVKENFGYEMFLFRPPKGEFSERVLAVAQNLGYRTVEWSFAYADWDPDNQTDPAVAFEKVKASACPGSIYLLHAVSSTNAAILGDSIDAFRQMGFELKTYAR